MQQILHVTSIECSFYKNIPSGFIYMVHLLIIFPVKNETKNQIKMLCLPPLSKIS